MPYKFEVDKTLPISGTPLDRRIRFTPEKKELAKELYALGVSLRKISRTIEIDRNSIKRFLFPEFDALCREKLKGRWVLYYNKEKHTKYVREHRQYKKNLIDKQIGVEDGDK